MFPRAPALFVFLLIATVALAPLAHAQQQAGLNWQRSAYDDRNTNSNPQNVINKDNVNLLELRWLYQVPEDPFKIPYVAPAEGLQTAPIIVNGLAYIATSYNRLIALNLETGNEVWRYQVNVSSYEDKKYSNPYAGKNYWWPVLGQKSLQYYDGNIYMMSSDCTVYVFDAQSGDVQYTIPDICKDVPGNTGGYFGEFAPVLYKNTLIVRASTQEGGGRGFVAAYDMSTKKLIWRWFSVAPVGGDPNWDKEAAKGNINPYPNDWGTTGLMGGGAVWSLIAVDEETNTIYFPTGHPSNPYDAALRPGPNLYADSIVALDASTGEMRWYYQINTHPLYNHEVGWSVILSKIDIGGQQKKVVIAGAKNDRVYVLDASTGKPVYNPIRVGRPDENIINNDASNNADLAASQKVLLGKIWCPGVNGGVEQAPAFDGKILYVATQRVCSMVTAGPTTYKGKVIDGYIYSAAPGARQNSSLYAIDVPTGKTKWIFEMPNRYQSASVVVSGGVVYAVDRAGYMYALNAENGQLLKRWSWGGLGAAGVTIGANAKGEMYLLAPAGGGQIGSNTAGVVAAFSLPKGLAPQGQNPPASSSGGVQLGTNEVLLIAVAISAVSVTIAVVAIIASRRKNSISSAQIHVRDRDRSSPEKNS